MVDELDDDDDDYEPITNTTTLDAALGQIVERLQRAPRTPLTGDLLREARRYQATFLEWEDEDNKPDQETKFGVLEKVMRLIADAVAVTKTDRPSRSLAPASRDGRRTQPQQAVGEARLSDPGYGSEPPTGKSMPPIGNDTTLVRPAMMAWQPVPNWRSAHAKVVHIDPDDGSAMTMVRLAHGGVIPRYTPPTSEIMYVLDGLIHHGDGKVTSGECLVTPAGVNCKAVVSSGETTILLIGYLREDLAE
jgi:quercetin dioxygenase-like cupin family protein